MENNKNIEITTIKTFADVVIDESIIAPILKTVRKEYIEVEPNVLLHVTDAGEGKAIVLLHGWPLSDEMYEYQYNDLINHNFRVIGITLRGFGKSSKPSGIYNYEIFAEDVKKVLCILNITDAVLGGFSMGGSIAIHYASIDDGAHVSKLALFAAAAPIWTQRPDYPYNLPTSEVDKLIALNYKDRPQLLSDFGKIFGASETSINTGISSWLYGMGLNSSSHAMAQSLIALRDTDLRKCLSKISIPTLIMHGKKDKICSYDMAEQLKSSITNSQLITFENSGHALFLEETAKFNSELIKFAQ